MRQAYAAELEQLRLQVEVMGIRVDQNLERMRDVLVSGDLVIAERAVNADDDIDAMNVSLTERCYDLLRREQPVASDLRFVVSVLRMLGEFERVGDLALRVIKLAPDHDLMRASGSSFDIVVAMADEAVDRYRMALRAWATMDLTLATELVSRDRSMSVCYERLMRELIALRGPDAARVAMRMLVGGQSLERITDHASVIGARLRYLITGDPDHLATEVR